MRADPADPVSARPLADLSHNVDDVSLNADHRAVYLGISLNGYQVRTGMAKSW